MKPPHPIPILAAGRLPQGRFGGALAGLGAVNLGADLVMGLCRGADLPRPTRIFWGMARSHTQGMNPARTLALKAGLGHGVPGSTVNQACGSSLEAAFQAASALALGHPGPILAGGSEAMSDTPHLLIGLRWGLGYGHRSLPDVMHQDGLRCPVTGLLMGETIERLARRLGLGRPEADTYAAESHRRAAATDFSTELVPHEKLERDECIRPNAHPGKLGQLPPVFEAQGQITAGNASALSDGAAALLLGAPGSGPALAHVLGWSEAALDPLDMGLGPVPAVQALLNQHRLRIPDIQLWELNEAFAVQVLACAQALGLPMDRLNVAGGGISLGHPIGASGARIVVTLIHRLRARGGGLGVATLGIGGGMGQAILVEVLQP